MREWTLRDSFWGRGREGFAAEFPKAVICFSFPELEEFCRCRIRVWGGQSSLGSGWARGTRLELLGFIGERNRLGESCSAERRVKLRSSSSGRWGEASIGGDARLTSPDPRRFCCFEFEGDFEGGERGASSSRSEVSAISSMLSGERLPF